MDDPFYVFKEEVQLRLNSTEKLFERWSGLLLADVSLHRQEIEWTQEEIVSSLKTTENDLAAVDDTIAVVEKNPSRFKLDRDEVAARKQFVSESRQRLRAIQASLKDPKVQRKMDSAKRDILMGDPNARAGSYGKLQEDSAVGEGCDQQLLIMRQIGRAHV